MMAIYKAPLRDMTFCLYELFDAGNLHQLPGYEEATPDLIDAILGEAAKLCEEVLLPLNRSGDEEGCQFEDGCVTTPKGFKEAYAQYTKGGWTSMGCDPEYGGMGLPKMVTTLFEEMICATNLSFAIYPGLTYGAYNAIHINGSEELKSLYLPKMVDGTWAGAMGLTEPQCGTDLGLIRTYASPQKDGSYRVTGTKIFISSGDHDLTENIIHLVLARTPDAPDGIRGISLFLVPKRLPNSEGNAGDMNGVNCGSIEHKMGIKGSATCVMNFEESSGWLIGDLHRGMQAMFVMMNQERLAVGMQGIGLAETSYQSAVDYARNRLQGRALTGTVNPEQNADPIISHPDVRRMLLTMRAYTEGSRALAVWIAGELDRHRAEPDAKRKQGADDFIQLMTPIAKALMTDLAYETVNHGVQVYGGHGYIRENGMEQLIRDCRISQLYEGTNGIQALDLVGRKLPAHMGRYLRQFFHPVQEYIKANQNNIVLAEFIGPLAKAFGRLQQASAVIAQKGLKNPDEAAAAASDYLRLFGIVALTYLWARMAEVSLQKLKTDDSDAEFYRAKLNTGRFFIHKLLPQTGALFATIMSGSRPLMDFEEQDF